MNNTLKQAAWVICAAGSIFISGCGGSSSGTAATTTTPTTTPVVQSTELTGTAAIGAPISGVVIAIDVNGKVSPPASTTGLGAFVVDVSGMTAPFILNIVGTAGGSQVTLNSIATAAGQTVNITPLTDLIVSTASGQPGGESLAALCAPVNNVTPAACLAALSAAATPANLTSAVDAVIAMIAPLNTGNVNPLTGAFVANGTGLDKVLDQILVSPAQSQGATATVTLISTNKPLGTVVLPATAGTASTIPAPTPPTTTELATANAAANVLPEIQACLASFNALYAAPFSAPSSVRVNDFVDPSFVFGNQTASTFVTNFSNGNAFEGFSLNPLGLSPFDMSPFSSTELGSITLNNINGTGRPLFFARTTTAIDLTSTPNTAWVKARPNNDPGIINMKMIRGAAYTGCAGGWKMAGTQHMDMHMNARINRAPNGTITREWAMHIAYADVTALGGTRVKVGGPGLSLYDSSIANGVKESASLDLVQGPSTTMTLASLGTAYANGTDAVKSCQDLKIAGVGGVLNDGIIPCMDESQAAPGKLYIWYVRDVVTPAIKAAFTFQTNAVPISKAFAQANASSVFASITSSTPGSLSAFAAKANSSLVNQITINYTIGTSYQAQSEHCGVLLFNNSTIILGGEQDSKRNATTCNFDAPYAITSTSGLFGFTATPTSGTIRVATTVLGNQAVSSSSLP